MKIRAGYDIAFQCPQAVPMMLMLTTHPTRDRDILSEQTMQFSPGVKSREFFDPFGNICTRLVAPAVLLEVRSDFIVNDSGLPDEVRPNALQWAVGDLPDDVLPFLLASRYCDTEKLSNLAWSLFGGIQSGWQRAQPSVITCTTGSSLGTSLPVLTERHRRVTKNVVGSVAIMRTWP